MQIKQNRRKVIKKYKGPINNHDIWKFIALALMFVDHTGIYIFQNLWLRVIGRLSFPIFAVIYGYHFKDRPNYSLMLYGLPIVTMNYFIGHYTLPLNILYSFVLGGIAITIYDKIKQPILKIAIIVALIAINKILGGLIEYGAFMFLFMLIARLDGAWKKLGFILVFAYYGLVQSAQGMLTPPMMAVLFAMLSVGGYLLYGYRLRKIDKINSKFLESFITIAARYSLEIYVIQACLFRLTLLMGK